MYLRKEFLKVSMIFFISIFGAMTLLAELRIFLTELCKISAVDHFDGIKGIFRGIIHFFGGIDKIILPLG
jgi:hypothetical protein